MTESDVVDHVIAALKRGEGGHIVTPNVDISRIVARDPEARRLVEDADLAVADGMPLVWAAKLLGTPVPGRITGADLIWSLSEAAAFYRYPVYLLGGPPGVASQAACNLIGRYPGLVVAGVDAPTLGFEDVPESYARVRDDVIATGPRLVFVGLGFPKQDTAHRGAPRGPARHLVRRLGSAIAFRRGHRPAAPVWAQRSGLEWLFRLLSEPGRLARRYLMDDLPYALRLLTVSLVRGSVPESKRWKSPCAAGLRRFWAGAVLWPASSVVSGRGSAPRSGLPRFCGGVGSLASLPLLRCSVAPLLRCSVALWRGQVPEQVFPCSGAGARCSGQVFGRSGAGAGSLSGPSLIPGRRPAP